MGNPRPVKRLIGEPNLLLESVVDRFRLLRPSLATPAWRANPDWGNLLGYDAAALAQ
jgi:hypothetical protein